MPCAQREDPRKLFFIIFRQCTTIFMLSTSFKVSTIQATIPQFILVILVSIDTYLGYGFSYLSKLPITHFFFIWHMKMFTIVGVFCNCGNAQPAPLFFWGQYHVGASCGQLDPLNMAYVLCFFFSAAWSAGNRQVWQKLTTPSSMVNNTTLIL